MKIFCKHQKGTSMYVCALVLCVGIAVLVTTCEKIGKCKTCTNTQTNRTMVLCGEDLKEAEELEHMTCK